MNHARLEREQSEMRARWSNGQPQVVEDSRRILRKESRPCKCGGKQILGAKGWFCRSCWGSETFAD